jgi:LysR family transcriptional regulator, hypochlorite-specific transcription factor HypT
MRLDWLDDILAVAKAGSFADAAALRNLTPSAFSRRIQMIEDHIGAPLFDRSRKPVQLFASAAALRDRMEHLAAELRALTTELRRGNPQADHRIVLVSQHALSAALTPGLVERIHHRHADLYLRLRSANLDECFALLLARQADVALVYRLPGDGHPLDADYIETQVIGADRLIPVCAAGQAMAVLADLAQGSLRVIAYPRDVFLGQVMDRRIHPALWDRCKITPVAETALTLAALELAIAGLGVAWLPRSLAQGRLAAGALADLSGDLPGLDLDVTAVRLTSQKSVAASAVWAILTNA